MQQLPVSDRSFQYGDGIFSTICVKNGQLQFWPLHWQRLQQSMLRLGFAPLTEADVKASAQAQISQQEQVVKVLISRGHGGRGYSPHGFVKPDLYCSSSALPDYAKAQQYGLSVGMAKLQLGIQPLLAGIKHTSRLETVLHKAEVEQSHFDELLVCDSQGYVTEFSSANVFFYLDGQWCTPELTQAGVAGIMRAFLLTKLSVMVGRYQPEDLKSATAMFATNALMGVVPVCSYLQQPLNLELVRPVQHLLLASLE